MCLLVTLQAQLVVDLIEVLPRKDLEARDDTFTGEVFGNLVTAGFGYLHLQSALAKPKLKNFSDVLFHFRLENDIVTGYT